MSAAKKMKTGIENLSTIDPEFAEYLKKEDAELLNFDLSDDDDDEDGDYDEDMELEEASDAELSTDDEKENIADDDDEEDSDDDDDKVEIRKVKLIPIDSKMIKKWNGLLSTDTPSALREISLGLRAAIQFNSPSKKEDDGKMEEKYVVEGIAVYSAILNLCLVEMVPAVYFFLNLKAPTTTTTTTTTNNTKTTTAAATSVKTAFETTAQQQQQMSKKSKKKLKKQQQTQHQGPAQPQQQLPQLQLEKLLVPTKSKSWKKIKVSMKKYLLNVLELIDLIPNEDLLLPFLKHLHTLINFYSVFPKIIKPLLKKLSEVWSRGEEATRVVAFRGVVRLMGVLNDKQLKFAFTNLYLAFVKNSRFTNHQTIAFIHFMKHSLVQLFSLKPDQAYKSSFYFIQQLAKHLHNALKLQKTQTTQVINNWQFCHSMSLWGAFICHNHHHTHIKALIHPMVEIVLATVRMNPAPVYIPLRLFCARILVELTEATGAFIPVLNIIVEPLELNVLHKDAKQSKMKSCLFSCCLRMNKNEVAEKAFLDATVDEVVELLLQYTCHYSASIALPELLTPTILQLKKYLKTSRATNYNKRIKVAMDKVQEGCEVVRKKRRNEVIDLKEPQAVKVLEEKWASENQSNPLLTYYKAFMDTKLKQIEIIYSKKDKLAVDDIPRMEKPIKEVKPSATDETRKSFSDLFNFGDDDDDEDEEEDVERFKQKEDRKKDTIKKSGEEDKEDDDDDDEDVNNENDDEKEEDDKEEEDDDDDVDEQPDLLEDLKLSHFEAQVESDDDKDDDDEDEDDDDEDD